MTPVALPTPLVSTAWLAEHLGQPGLVIVDASSYLPTHGRDARAEYAQGHVPGAFFADMEAIHDESSSLPHTFPSPEQFSASAGALGIGNDTAVVVYDASGQNFSAPRLWFMLRAFGHERVAVLDGGLRRWVMDGRPVEEGVNTAVAQRFDARLDERRVLDAAAVMALIGKEGTQLADARSAGRFAAEEPEPRPGVRGGHIPGSRNVHYARLVNDDGTLRSEQELRSIMADAGVDPSRPVVTSCGSGLTACAIVLALDVLGAPAASVYDGSWTEWGGRSDTPVETGPAR